MASDDAAPRVELEATARVATLSEDEALRALLEAGQDLQQSTVPIDVTRRRPGGGEEVLFTFRVRGLSQEELRGCRRAATRRYWDRQTNRQIDDFDEARYQAEVIYAATADDDRRVLWDNRRAWERYNVVAGWQLIQRVLKPGVQDRVLDVVAELSGFDMTQLIEDAKN